MTNQWWFGCLTLLLLALFGLFLARGESVSLSSVQASRMGRQIWQNECGAKVEGLTAWNKGEEFPSLGIGHFIWFPEGRKLPFKETFPELLAFFKAQGIVLPHWLESAQACPWKTREEFYTAYHQPKLRELRQFLADHVETQVLFMVARLHRALPLMIQHVPAAKRDHVTYQFYRLANTAGGLFVLLDYLNFKGEGTASHESYQGQGWGLLQVLLNMHGTEPGLPAIEEFIAAAKTILTLRVGHAPPERGEGRWLKGWHRRLDGYRHFSLDITRS